MPLMSHGSYGFNPSNVHEASGETVGPMQEQREANCLKSRGIVYGPEGRCKPKFGPLLFVFVLCY